MEKVLRAGSNSDKQKKVKLQVKKKLYLGCVQPIIMYASETWEMTNAMMERLRRVEMRMVRWMCGVTLLDKIPSEELKTRTNFK